MEMLLDTDTLPVFGLGFSLPEALEAAESGCLFFAYATSGNLDVTPGNMKRPLNHTRPALRYNNLGRQSVDVCFMGDSRDGGVSFMGGGFDLCMHPSKLARGITWFTWS
jgi:hypothetical protein